MVMSRQSRCFVVMPFRPELNFFYLYMKKYLEDKHGIRVERGDSEVLTKALMEKIRDQIVESDVIIGDVTGKNPNVFYELGIAQAFGKPVIFLTQDPPEQAPVDIRQFEFIGYDLARHEEFLAKLDNAIQNVFGQRYREFYQRACELLRSFNADTGSTYAAAPAEEFQARVMRGEQTEGMPPGDRGALVARFLLPKILLEATDITVMIRVTAWLSEKFPSGP
jgi:hypothetical protein